MLMPGRSFTSNSYRYGAFGYEKDDEVNGNGNNYTTEARPYDPRLIRWWTPDPKFKLQPSWSPYKAFLCNPILFTDPAGETEYITITINDQRTGKTTTITKVVSDEIFPDNVVHMVDDGLGGYYNQRNWYDKQTTYNVTIDKDGKATSTSSTRLVKENGVRETTSGPLINSSTWANFSIPELEGEGGIQEGGFYLTSADGGASPTKFKSLSDAEARDVGDLLDALGALGSGKKSLLGEVSLGGKRQDQIKDLTGLVESTIDAKDQLGKGGSSSTYCKSCQGNYKKDSQGNLTREQSDAPAKDTVEYH
jgi:RHS repeat-associated protein